MNYGDFEKQIDALNHLAKAVAASDGLNYTNEDRNQVLLSASIFRVLKDSIVFKNPDNNKGYTKYPFSYDMEDFWGEKDWKKMFVTKLLFTQSGNCHSLPSLYKILADELGVKAYLSIVPNHTYIKQWSDKTGWYNTELTNGTFPFDANIKLNSYIKTEAIAAGVYMDTLSAKEDIAYVMTDLVQGYLKKTDHSDIAVPLTWLNTALLHYPDFPNAMILKAELQKEQYAQVMKEKGAINFSALWKDNTMRAKFAELEKSYYQIHELGYRRMPKEMYLNWLLRVKNDTTRNPYVFTNPQPFKQYNYNVQIVSGGDGQNSEAFDTEEVVRIGTVELNRITGKIVKFIEYNEDEIPDEVISRMYDPALGRWWVMDGKSDLYFGTSPYVYALNRPINAIDPDGNVVIFINGNHFGEGATGYEKWRQGTSSYNWQGSNAYWNQGNQSVDGTIMAQLNDNNAIYRDGANGGRFGFSSDDPIGVLSPYGRIFSGYKQGERDAKTIIENLARDQTTGEIIESIKIITHSMGGAYGKGYVKALKEYISTLSKEQQKQIRISLVADFDPFQAGFLEADPDIFTQQFSHIGKNGRKSSDRLGWLANQKQEGVDDYHESETDSSHSIYTFFDNFKSLQEGTYKWNGSSWVCTTCK